MKILNLILVTLTFLISVIILPYLPALIPMHWNIYGQVDSFWPKDTAVWFLPVLALVIWILFQVLPHLDPKKENYKLFAREWQIIQTGLIGFFVYLHLVIFYVTLNPAQNLLPLMFAGLGSLFIIMGSVVSKIKQNYFVGFKLPWTLASEENWNKTHHFASWCFIAVGILTLTESFFLWSVPLVIFGGIILAVILPVVYSFLVFKKKKPLMKSVFLILLITLTALFAIRLSAGEDDWICREGQWVKHGNPSAPVPQTSCQP